MAHDHSHDHDAGEYFIEQLFTILVCGGLGVVAVRMYQTGMLGNVLAPGFHLPVLIGGIAVIVLVAVRAVSVWREAGEARGHAHGPDCDHDHDHKPGHDHDHGHTHGPDCDHAHDHVPAPTGASDGGEDDGHTHDLSWAFARLLILAFPIALYTLGLPNAGFSNDHVKQMLGREESVGEVGTVAAKAGTVTRFDDLNNAAYDPGLRAALEGQTAVLEGKFRRLGDKEFTLFRLKMTCCAADTVPLKVRIVAPRSLSDIEDFGWVRVTGRVQFVKVPNKEQYVPVITLADNADVTPIPGRSDFE